MLYCKESDVNVKKELDFINFSFLKHNLVSLGFYPFNVKEIISIRRDYFSTFTFTFSKQWKNVFDKWSNKNFRIFWQCRRSSESTAVAFFLYIKIYLPHCCSNWGT